MILNSWKTVFTDKNQQSINGILQITNLPNKSIHFKILHSIVHSFKQYYDYTLIIVVINKHLWTTIIIQGICFKLRNVFLISMLTSKILIWLSLKYRVLRFFHLHFSIYLTPAECFYDLRAIDKWQKAVGIWTLEFCIKSLRYSYFYQPVSKID